jgi:acyl-CoA synthetase (AMP-forming)/AMP-acid ligase II
MHPLITHHTLQAQFAARLERDPGGRAVAFMDDAGRFEWYTFERFAGLAGGYAARLQAEGLRPGEVCIIVLPSGEQSATLLLAALLLGAVPLMMAPPALQRGQALSSLEEVVARVMRRTRPRVVVLPESLAGRRDDLERSSPGARVIVGEGALAPEPARAVLPHVPGADAIAAMQLTSGTTGFPRVCVWRQANVMAALDGMALAMGLVAEDVCLNWTPLYHDMGLVNNTFLCLSTGVPMVLMSPSDFVRDPSLWLKGLQATGSTATWSPNFGFALAAQRVADEDIAGLRLDGVRGFWNAAERIHHETLVAFERRFRPYGLRPDAVKTNFGCAENVGGATFSAVDAPYIVEHVDRARLYGKQIATPVAGQADPAATVAVVSAGRPHPGIRIDIVSPRGKVLPDGHVGEVALHTPSRMEGYLHDRKATDRALADGRLRTGDLAYMRNGELFWVGRLKERITIRGKKLDPSEFERVLLGIPELRAGCFAAFGVEGADEGTEHLVLVAEVRPDCTLAREELASRVRRAVFLTMGLNVSEVALVRQGTLSKTSSGKRRHRFFRQLHHEGRLAEFEWTPAALQGAATS